MTVTNLRAVAADVRYRMDTVSADAVAFAADEIERLRLVVVHAAACNPDATGKSAEIALRQIVKHARAALSE